MEALQKAIRSIFPPDQNEVARLLLFSHSKRNIVEKILLLINKDFEYCVFVYKVESERVNSASDLSIEKLIPLSASVTCCEDLLGNLVFVVDGETVSYSIVQSPEEKNFLQEVNHALDVIRTRIGSLAPRVAMDTSNRCEGSFDWLNRYKDKLYVVDNPFVGDVFDPSKYLDEEAKDVVAPLAKPDTSWKETSDTGSKGQASSKPAHHVMRATLYEYLPNRVATKRDTIVRLLLENRSEEYASTRQFRVFVGTWNTNGQNASVPLPPWLAAMEDPPDIYAVGFQELDLSKEAFVFEDSSKEAEWASMVSKGLHPKAKYHKLPLIRLVGIMLLVFVRDEHFDRIAEIQTSKVGTGLMGRMGNKGGVAVRFRFYDSTLCFVNSHLAAHQDELQRRNEDYKAIDSRTKFVLDNAQLSIIHHDVVFWLGDLNYRIQNHSYDKVIGMLESKRYEDLLQHDQLRLQQKQKSAFNDYKEGDITFAPTYKYDTGTDTFDTSEKSRVPAWCDRILWHGDTVQQLNYCSHTALKISDHKPVSAMFNVGIQMVDAVKYRRIYEEIMKDLDRKENEILPQVSLDCLELHFKDVKFMEPQTQRIRVTNTGQLPVRYEFLQKMNESHYCKPWLTIRPDFDIIPPGKSQVLEFEVLIDKNTVFSLHADREKLEDILIFHLEGGKDIFLTIDGNYIPSCFGCSLEMLARLTKPILEASDGDLIDLGDATKEHKMPPLDVPKEVWILIDFLYHHAMNTPNLFVQNGLHDEKLAIRDCLDTGKYNQLPSNVHSIAEMLLIFLLSLPEPVIPYNQYKICLHVANNSDQSHLVLSKVAAVHQNVFKHIMAFLRKLLKNAAVNQMDRSVIVPLIASILIRSPGEAKQGAADSPRRPDEEKLKCQFLEHFLSDPLIDLE